jgi:hypothetical protein
MTCLYCVLPVAVAGGSVTGAVLALEEPEVDAGDGDEEVEAPEEVAAPGEVADPLARSVVALGAGSRLGAAAACDGEDCGGGVGDDDGVLLEAPIDDALEEPAADPPVEVVLGDGAGITRIDPPLADS